MGKNQQHKAAQRTRHGDGEDGQPDLGTGEVHGVGILKGHESKRPTVFLNSVLCLTIGALR